MLPVVNRIRNELADAPAIVALVGTRVRTHDPNAGDIQEPFQAFIVLSQLAAPRMIGFRKVPVQMARIIVRCYGTTASNAAEVWAAVVDAIHGAGPRIHSNGLGIFESYDDTGGTDDSDPDTKQPVMTGVLLIPATTEAVA